MFLDTAAAVAPYFTTEPTAIFANQSDSVTLHCDAEPAGVDIWWLKDGATVTSRRSELVRGRQLRIPGWRPSTSKSPEISSLASVYQCIANNSVGALVSRHAKVTRTCECSISGFLWNL